MFCPELPDRTPFVPQEGGLRPPYLNYDHLVFVVKAASLIDILELELIQTQMAQKPVLRAEVYAHAMRASQNRKKEVRREKEV